jgi:hypothetical protein
MVVLIRKTYDKVKQSSRTLVCKIAPVETSDSRFPLGLPDECFVMRVAKILRDPSHQIAWFFTPRDLFRDHITYQSHPLKPCT